MALDYNTHLTHCHIVGRASEKNSTEWRVIPEIVAFVVEGKSARSAAAAANTIKPERIKIMKRRISITLTILSLLLGLGLLGLWLPATTTGGSLPALQGEAALNRLKTPDGLQVETGGDEGRSHHLGMKLRSAVYGERQMAARAGRLTDSGARAGIRHELRHSESTDQSGITEWRIDSVRARGDEREGSTSQPHVVLVHPLARGVWTAPTIQEGIEMVAPGGRVFVLPETYPERLTVSKGVTVQGIGGPAWPVIIEPPDIPPSVIEVATSEPVVLRGLTVHVPGSAGIRGIGAVDLTVEWTKVLAVNPPIDADTLITVANNLADGRRARMVVRHNFIDGTVPNPPFAQNFGVRPEGDVDALIERNVIRRTGGACIFVLPRSDLGGELNADILDNDLDECHPAGRVAAIIVGPFGANLPSPTRPITATGTVNIIGNKIANSTGACLNSAIDYEVFSGRIERNRIESVVKPCAAPTGRNLPAAIWIGRLTPAHPFPPVTPTVRFNDIVGNAHAGLGIAPNQTIPIDASCNYWGSESGPSGLGAGTGDAIVVQPGGAAPEFMPFATKPIAGRKVKRCSQPQQSQ
jgi:hypothetical protein